MNSLDENLLSSSQISRVLDRYLKSNLLSEEDDLIAFYDLAVFQNRMRNVQHSFPDYWKHSIAIKSNPLTNILKHATAQGFGLEAASYEESLQASVCKAPFTVWDSPVKSEKELQRVIQGRSPVFINANDLDELLALEPSSLPSTIQVGLRINPQSQSSAHESMRVGGLRSKFGEPIQNAAVIKETFLATDKKIGLHIHASSQNLHTDEAIASIKKVYDLADEIGWKHIAFFDIGGGYPVDYGFEPVAPIATYARDLQAVMPKLFDDSIPVITEFGRYYHANAGWTFSRIASVKHFGGAQTIIQHAGADLFLRECYEPGKWPHRFFIHPANSSKQNKMLRTDIGGPLCFGGDYLAKDIDLPCAKAGDSLVILDTGANSFALWSKHCSRPFPKVIGYDDNGLMLIKDKQTSEDAIAIWS